MFKMYLKEKEKLDVLEKEYGFVGYRIHFGGIFEIADFFIHPKYRNGINSLKLHKEIEEVAKKNNCNKLISYVNLEEEKPENSLFLVLRNKYKYSHIYNQLIYFYKNI